jgi:23S rRNA-/tRNA-specific pseudouridylate synthase
MLSHPIMGDPDYWFQDGGRLAPPTSSLSAGSGRGGGFIPPRLEGRGIFLWSVGISFDHPVTGQRIELSIPEPDSYAQLREHLRSPP